MGTSYTILKRAGLEIELDEYSNVFDLSLSADDDQLLHAVEGKDDNAEVYAVDSVHTNDMDLTPAELVGMALEMLKVASYWMGSDEFDAAVKAKMNADGGVHSYLATYLRSMGQVAQEGDPVQPVALSPTGRTNIDGPERQDTTPRDADKAALFASFYGGGPMAEADYAALEARVLAHMNPIMAGKSYVAQNQGTTITPQTTEVEVVWIGNGNNVHYRRTGETKVRQTPLSRFAEIVGVGRAPAEGEGS